MHRLTTTSLLPIALATATVLGLMALLVHSGHHFMEGVKHQLVEVVEHHNVKLDRVIHVRKAARERALILHEMLLLDDPFELDEAWLRFLAHGAEAAEERARFISMGVDATEREILDRQAALSGPAFATFDRIAELILTGDRITARKLLKEQAMPLQERVFAQLNRLYHYQEEAAAHAREKVERHYHASHRIFYGLGIGAALFTIVIGVWVARRTSRAERGLKREKEKAEVTLRSIGDGVVTTDAQGRITYINGKAEELTGWSDVTSVGRPLEAVFRIGHEESHARLPDPAAIALAEGRVVDSESGALLIGRNGREFAVEYTASPVLDDEEGTIGAVVVFHDVSDLHTLSRQLSYQASHDPLTGLINRREFERRLGQALENAHAEALHHALCFLDLDQFKVINDTCGHQAGDELLKRLSSELRARLRKGDVLARLGGDEFAVLLEECPLEKAEELAETLRRVVEESRFLWEGQSFEVGVSVGLVPLDNESGTLYDVMRLADAACYVAKEAGRNRVHVHTPDSDEIARRNGEMNWFQRIRQALDQDRFRLHVQPIVALGEGEGRRDYYEVLLRMEEDGRLVPPMAFLPTAERYQLMPLIDRWVVSRLLDTLTERFADRPQAAPTFSINLSGQSLGDKEFAAFLIDAVAESGLPGSAFCFEITESTAIANLSGARALIDRMRELGCAFMLDDFGSGLSSFSYLKSLPVHCIKIDGGFIRDIADDPVDRSMVESMNQVAKVLGIATVAEYVENEQTLTLLREIGVDYAQGYHIGKPHPIELLLTRLAPPRRRPTEEPAAPFTATTPSSATA